MSVSKKRSEGYRVFPVGTIVRVKEGCPDYVKFKNTFDQYEPRGYMVVTGHSDDGWLRFDNRDYTMMGGSWNPNRYKKYKKPDVFSGDLFKI